MGSCQISLRHVSLICQSPLSSHCHCLSPDSHHVSLPLFSHVLPNPAVKFSFQKTRPSMSRSYVRILYSLCCLEDKTQTSELGYKGLHTWAPIYPASTLCALATSKTLYLLSSSPRYTSLFHRKQNCSLSLEFPYFFLWKFLRHPVACQLLGIIFGVSLSCQ